MESFSEVFRRQVEALIAGDTPLLATVASHGVGFVKQVRQDRRITLLRMRRTAREGLVGEIVRRLKSAGIGS
jgi:nucleoside-triphosphatase THEP1